MTELLNHSAARTTRLIASTARLWRRAADRRLQPFGLTEATWLPLLHISLSTKPMRQKDLADKLVIDGSSVVRVVDSLEAANLVYRADFPGDRRSKILVLTTEGRHVLTQVEHIALQLATEASDGIDNADIETTERVLSRIGRFLANDLGEQVDDDI